MPISATRKKARVFVLRQAAAWIEEQTGEASSDILLGEDGEYDEDKLAEAASLAKRLYRQADKLEKSLKEGKGCQ